MLIFDNSDLRRPFQMAAIFEGGRRADAATPLPEWTGVVGTWVRGWRGYGEWCARAFSRAILFNGASRLDRLKPVPTGSGRLRTRPQLPCWHVAALSSPVGTWLWARGLTTG